MSKKITQNYLSLTPAYGRDYRSAKDAKESFLAGKNWIDAQSGSYCSVDDFASGVTVNLRYKQLRSVAVVKVPKLLIVPSKADEIILGHKPHTN